MKTINHYVENNDSEDPPIQKTDEYFLKIKNCGLHLINNSQLTNPKDNLDVTVPHQSASRRSLYPSLSSTLRSAEPLRIFLEFRDEHVIEIDHYAKLLD